MASLTLEVEYYDDEQKDLFSKQDLGSKIDDIIKNGLTIDDEEFFQFGAFQHQQDSDGFQTRDDLKRLVPKLRNSMLPEYFDLKSGTVRSIFIGQDSTHKDSTELCGVGASLAVVSHIYDLTEADWEKIAVSQEKDLDFRTKASDGNKFVIVEAKGRIVSSLDGLAEVSQAKSDIIKKKLARRASSGRDAYIGVVAAFPEQSGRLAKCRLVDPPIANVPEDPKKYKLVARLSHYHRELGTITRAHFLIALANRIQALSLVDDYERLDNAPLIDQRSEPFVPPASVFRSRSVFGNDTAFGEVIPLGNGEFYFYGFVSEILNLMIDQNHERILKFAVEDSGTSVESDVIARLFPRELEMAGIDISKLGKVPNSSRREITMTGRLTTTSGGHVLGVVTPELIDNLNMSPQQPTLFPMQMSKRRHLVRD